MQPLQGGAALTLGYGIQRRWRWCRRAAQACARSMVRTVEPARALAAEALALEHQISDKRERRLRPDARGDRPDVANRPAADADCDA